MQIAIGPVFFFAANLTLQKTLQDGIACVAAVVLADYIYIILAIVGVGKLLEKKKMKNVLGYGGSLILILFGLFMINSFSTDSSTTAKIIRGASDLRSSFLSAFALTISSPLTIVFWTGIFTAKSIENNYDRNELFIFGLSAGLSTILFLGIAVVLLSLVKASIPSHFACILNSGVGILLIGYGVIRFLKL